MEVTGPSSGVLLMTAAEAPSPAAGMCCHNREATAATLVSRRQGHGLLAQLGGRKGLEEAAVQRLQSDLCAWIRAVYIIASGVRKCYINLLIRIKLTVMLIQMCAN